MVSKRKEFLELYAKYSKERKLLNYGLENMSSYCECSTLPIMNEINRLSDLMDCVNEIQMYLGCNDE